jgi:hypothetical protein
MRGLFIKIVIVAVCFSLASCEETEKETMVWGTIQVDAASSATRLDGGTLAEKGADYVGSCKLENNRFSFAIGSATKNNLTGADFYYEILGIEGPPSKNPYTDTGDPRDNEERSMRSGYVWINVGEWRFNSDDILEERCRVSLFAEAGSGDLTPLSYGKKSFQYLVKITCPGGLDYVPNSQVGPELTGINAELWFANCD